MRESDLQGALLTTPATIPPILGGCSPYSGLNVGEYVDMSDDQGKGKCSHGGMAYVTTRSGPRADAMYTVSYRNGVEQLKSTLETNVPISWQSPMPFHFRKLPKRSHEKAPPVASRPLSDSQKPANRQL
jgi:hypothetical protein